MYVLVDILTLTTPSLRCNNTMYKDIEKIISHVHAQGFVMQCSTLVWTILSIINIAIHLFDPYKDLINIKDHA